MSKQICLFVGNGVLVEELRGEEIAFRIWQGQEFDEISKKVSFHRCTQCKKTAISLIFFQGVRLPLFFSASNLSQLTEKCPTMIPRPSIGRRQRRQLCEPPPPLFLLHAPFIPAAAVSPPLSPSPSLQFPSQQKGFFFANEL